MIQNNSTLYLLNYGGLALAKRKFPILIAFYSVFPEVGLATPVHKEALT